MTLLELFALMRKHIGLIITLPLMCAFITAAVSWGVLPNEYTAETSIYALTKSSTAKDATDVVTSSDLSASQMLANDFAELAKNDQVQTKTAESLGLDDLKAFKVAVNSSTTTRIIKVAVTGRDPESVALVANELAKQIGETAVRIMNVEAVNVVSEAKAPTDPSGPRRALYTLVALLAGLFVSIAIVVIMDMVDTTIRDDEEAVALLEAPVLGRFPVDKGGRR